MARGESLDSASTSFFICLAPQPSLDGKYTVFGRVVTGVIEKMGSVPPSITKDPRKGLIGQGGSDHEGDLIGGLS
jgi:cyclophilin family peptidyl-prolyl cis-trans isomerase